MAVWLTGTVSTAVVATQNFYTIDRLLDAQPNPAFRSAVEKLGRDSMREVLRYLSSELNRLYFQYWNLAQLAVGILALWLVVKLPDASQAKWTIVAMLGTVLFMTVLITPAIRTFGLLHATYTVLDGVLLILGGLVTVWLQKKND